MLVRRPRTVTFRLIRVLAIVRSPLI